MGEQSELGVYKWTLWRPASMLGGDMGLRLDSRESIRLTFS